MKKWSDSRAPAGRVAYVNGRYLPFAQASVHVEDRALHLQSLQRFDDRGKLVSPVFLVSRPETHLAAIQKTEQTITIELQFVQPLVSFRCFRHECRQLRRNKLGHRCLARSGKILDFFRSHWGSTKGTVVAGKKYDVRDQTN